MKPQPVLVAGIAALILSAGCGRSTPEVSVADANPTPQTGPVTSYPRSPLPVRPPDIATPTPILEDYQKIDSNRDLWPAGTACWAYESDLAVFNRNARIQMLELTGMSPEAKTERVAGQAETAAQDLDRIVEGIDAVTPSTPTDDGGTRFIAVYRSRLVDTSSQLRSMPEQQTPYSTMQAIINALASTTTEFRAPEVEYLEQVIIKDPAPGCHLGEIATPPPVVAK